MFMPRHVHLGGVPIAVPGDEDVLAIGLDVEGVGCLGNICCLSLRRRPSSLPRVPSITIRRKSVHDKVEQFFLPLTLENCVTIFRLHAIDNCVACLGLVSARLRKQRLIVVLQDSLQ